MSTALVHDYLLVMRGGERTFRAISECWPAAPIYTLLYDRRGTAGAFADRDVTTSYLQRLRLRQGSFRRALPLLAHAVERLELKEHDVVISSSSAFAHGVRVADEAVHICYCHSPFRYVWHDRGRAHAEVPHRLRPLLDRVLDGVGEWDLRCARRVTHYIANSQITRSRIQNFYGREATVIHPPVEVNRFTVGAGGDYALVVSEITHHKRVDCALEAARRAGHPIKVVGSGPALPGLRSRFASSAEFLGRVSDRELAALYAGARMFVMANVEEFGIAAVEAQAAGRPVVAVAAGGALETVLPGKTGVLVPADNVDALAEAIRYTDFERFSSAEIRRNAERFSTQAFKERLRREVATVIGNRAHGRSGSVAQDQDARDR